MRVPDEVLKCVGFVLYKKNDNFELAGTSFFVVAYTSEEFPALHFGYAVTAKHVIVKCKQKGEDGKAYIRVNTQPGVSDEPGLIETVAADWLEHPNTPDSVDVAVLPIYPPQDQIDYAWVSSTMAISEDAIAKEGIGVGDETFITGLFTGHSLQAKRNVPIVRIGNLASMREENVPTSVFGNIAAYLVECRSIGGLSGSPVFVHPTGPTGTGTITVGPRPFYWLGLMHGHWNWEGKSLPEQDESEWEDVKKLNMGIAIVVPADKVLETLEHPKLVAARQKREEKQRKKRAARPVMDSAEAEDECMTREGFMDALEQVSRPDEPPPDEASG